MEEKIITIMENVNYLYQKTAKTYEIMDNMTSLIGAQQQVIDDLQVKIAELEGKIQNGG